ncbi:LysR family transcriptional regulator [Nocardioides daphniae]|uniref:LysR family transcriptional regulator n=1 Tax=Nocardioides daphniae TaxID=402297 RepID=A0A4P7UID8_9ACTN|nr:LysR family transcriptional regulator [Nocardioides daphniae]QCC78309.1 LysR family transcriptional regulator [Nocardioides daphniae]GGD13680.1 LysR family transcriptional regulator [Nocardioides daphniae]
MLSLHQLTCFLATYEHGSFTAAAEDLGYAQPSVSEQVRALEKTVGGALFTRVGRGVVPTQTGHLLRPHAEKVLGAADEALRAVRSSHVLETGTIRFGMFGIARLYAGAGLVSDVVTRHPGVRVELVGQNSSEVTEELRRGRLEAAMVAVPALDSEGLEVRPVARDELVYVSADPARTAAPVTVEQLAAADLVMPEATWRRSDSTRIVLRQLIHAAGLTPRTRIEVEDVETAVELAGMGHADTVVPRGAARALLPRLAPDAAYVSLAPRQWDTLAIVHRAGATLSPAARLMIELATRRIQTVAEPIDEPVGSR